VEGYRQRRDDEYRRERIECRLANGFSQRAWVYRYARPLAQRERLRPDPDGLVRWRPKGDLDPIERQASRLGRIVPRPSRPGS
jgi:hypothetical protein